MEELDEDPTIPYPYDQCVLHTSFNILSVVGNLTVREFQVAGVLNYTVAGGLSPRGPGKITNVNSSEAPCNGSFFIYLTTTTRSPQSIGYKVPGSLTQTAIVSARENTL